MKWNIAVSVCLSVEDLKWRVTVCHVFDTDCCYAQPLQLNAAPRGNTTHSGVRAKEAHQKGLFQRPCNSKVVIRIRLESAEDVVIAFILAALLFRRGLHVDGNSDHAPLHALPNVTNCRPLLALRERDHALEFFVANLKLEMAGCGCRRCGWGKGRRWLCGV